MVGAGRAGLSRGRRGGGVAALAVPAPPTADTAPPALAAASPSTDATRTSGYDQAAVKFERLPVKGWDRHTDFARYRFGEAWSDDVNVEFGHNGCNTRDDILRRDLADLVVRPGTCYAQSGVLLHDLYTGESTAFVRGSGTSTPCRSTTWSRCPTPGTRAREWDPQRRRDFANDPHNLLAVGAQVNFDKAFRDATAWLPPNGLPLRVRRPPDRGQDELPAVGVEEREAGDGRRAGRLLASGTSPSPVSARGSSARRGLRRALSTSSSSRTTATSRAAGSASGSDRS